jgi:hypothetical protein
VSPPSFGALMPAFPWLPIRGCPGRYRLAALAAPVSLQDLLGPETCVERFQVPTARDPVWVARFGDGAGLISYERPDGTFVHTLNTPDGLRRKLTQLGISTRS